MAELINKKRSENKRKTKKEQVAGSAKLTKLSGAILFNL